MPLSVHLYHPPSSYGAGGLVGRFMSDCRNDSLPQSTHAPSAQTVRQGLTRRLSYASPGRAAVNRRLMK